jgi:signal transduction histidine kinase
MPHSLFSRLVVVLLALLSAIGVFYVVLTVTTTRLHIQEVTQHLNRTLAADLAGYRPLIKEDNVDQAALKNIFDMLMVVNPAIEVYLLDPRGSILAYSAAPEKIKRDRVSLAPIKAFIKKDAKLPIRGDDPRDPRAQKIFSAVSITQGNRVRGYLYVVLGGETYQSVAHMFETSWIMRLGAGVAVASLGLIAVIGILLFNWLTRRLRRLTARVGSFHLSESAETSRAGEPQSGRPVDEIDELALSFAEMAKRIDVQIDELALQMKDQTIGEQEKRRYLDLAHKHSQRLGRLINDLFDLTTLESGDRQLRLEPFSLAELVQDVAQKFHAMADEKGLRLELDIPLNSSLVRGDIGLIERVLANLTENAVKYTPAGGQIRLGVVGGQGRISAHVTDTGVGIPADELGRVFERTYRVAKERGEAPDGAGLGLAIAQRIIQLHQGHLTVDSSPDAGTTFTFDLATASED